MFAGCCDNLGAVAPASTQPIAPVAKTPTSGERVKATPWNYYITMPPQLSILTVGASAPTPPAVNPAPLTNPVLAAPQQAVTTFPPVVASTVVSPVQNQPSRGAGSSSAAVEPISGASILSTDEYQDRSSLAPSSLVKSVLDTKSTPSTEPLTLPSSSTSKVGGIKSENLLLLALAGGIIILISSTKKGGT